MSLGGPSRTGPASLPHPHPRHHHLARVAGEQQQQHADEHLDASEPPTAQTTTRMPIELGRVVW